MYFCFKILCLLVYEVSKTYLSFISKKCYKSNLRTKKSRGSRQFCPSCLVDLMVLCTRENTKCSLVESKVVAFLYSYTNDQQYQFVVFPWVASKHCTLKWHYWPKEILCRKYKWIKLRDWNLPDSKIWGSCP